MNLSPISAFRPGLLAAALVAAPLPGIHQPAHAVDLDTATVEAALASAPPLRPRLDTIARIASCIEGSPPLTLGAADRQALLDPQDRELFEVAALTRYPMLDHDGFRAVQILLWARRPDAWMYVALQPGTAGVASAPCFTAVFTGAAFEFTPDLVRKYFKGRVDI